MRMENVDGKYNYVRHPVYSYSKWVLRKTTDPFAD